MTATAADTGFGAAFQYEATHASGTFTDFAEVVEINPPEITRETVDATHMASPDGYREFIGAMRDGGEAEIVYNLIPGNAADDILDTHANSDIVRNYRIEFPSGAYLAFTALCTAHPRAIPMDDKMTGSATFKVSGKPVMTDAA